MPEQTDWFTIALKIINVALFLALFFILGLVVGGAFMIAVVSQ